MSRSKYYAYRQGEAMPPLEYDQLQRVLAGMFEKFEGEGWFQAKLGLDCTDEPKDIGGLVLGRIGFECWPFSRAMLRQPEEWLFTIVEFAYDLVSQPVATTHHKWNNCGVHVTRSDEKAGRKAYRDQINSALSRYTPAYELRADGEIWATTPEGLEEVEPVATGDLSIDDRVRSAIRTFRRYGADADAKRQSVRDLADVFEYLRDTVGTQLLRKDEADLFNMANNFGIRHHNPEQRTDYDSGLWLDWMFYSFLNSVTLVSKLLVRIEATE